MRSLHGHVRAAMPDVFLLPGLACRQTDDEKRHTYELRRSVALYQADQLPDGVQKNKKIAHAGLMKAGAGKEILVQQSELPPVLPTGYCLKKSGRKYILTDSNTHGLQMRSKGHGSP